VNESQTEAWRYRLLDRALTAGVLPDPVLRAGSRYGAWARERRESAGGTDATSERLRALVARMSSGPIAELPEKANEQHYELPPEFFGLFLGPRRKYSGCLWPPGVDSLAAAEEAMLALTCARAGVVDGMRVLDLGCGWGSLSLWLAERYPSCSVLGVSNSAPQRSWILAEAARRGLDNLAIVTADVNEFTPDGSFDRVISIEMFEHMRNWRELLARVGSWLAADGRAFVHVFSHRTLPYRFTGTWAAARFFTAGLMPSHDLLLRFAADLHVVDSWMVPGTHYARTLAAWRVRLDDAIASGAAAEVLRASGRSAAETRRLLATWRLFLISTEVMWGYRGGNRWLVSQYLLEPGGR
jgi:cyclopropane-fatty-acyl-phospholipid synthase